MKSYVNPPRFVFVFLVFVYAVLAFAQAGHAQQVIYVKADATGANDGSSWQDAFTQLQPAIDAATAADQIWVAGGTYYPSQQRISGVNRSRSFVIPDAKNGLRIFGGFAGNETQLSQRVNPQAHVSRLSGDMDQNDGPLDIYSGTEPNLPLLEPTSHIKFTPQPISLPAGALLIVNDESNVYSVIALGGGIGRETVWDGFTVSGGFAVEQNTDLYFANELYYSGGGLNCAGCSATFRNMRFEGNFSMNQGGGVSVYSSGNPLFVNTVFYGNAAGGYIPGQTDLNGIVRFYMSNGNIIDNLFLESGEGGAIYVESGNPEIINSTLFGNLSRGSGHHIRSLAPFSLKNSVVWGRGSLMPPEGSDPPVWAGSSDFHVSSGVIKHSVLESPCPSGVSCEVTTTVNPLLDEDLRIDSEESSAVNLGSNAFLPPDTDDLNGNNNTTEPLPYDAAGNPRIQQVIIDAGAFESPFGDISPSVAAVSPGQRVEINVPGASSNTQVSINNEPVDQIEVLSSARIAFIVPEGATTGLIDIVTPDMSFSSTSELVITPGSGGRALRASGNGSVDIPANEAVSNRSFSISFWMRVTDPGQFNGEIMSHSINNLEGWVLEKNPESNISPLRFRERRIGSPNLLNAPDSPNFLAGDWHHVVLTLDWAEIPGSVPQINLFVDNLQTHMSSTPFTVRDLGLVVGSGNGFEIDNLMIWNRALVASEVADIRRKHLKLSPYEPEADGLVASYRFDADNPTTVYDYAGRNNGTISDNISRTEFSGAPVAATISNPAGPEGAQISISVPEYQAFITGAPDGAPVPVTRAGEIYGFEVPEAQARRMPVHWTVFASAKQPASITINYSDISFPDAGILKVIYRRSAGSPWVPAPGNWVHDPAQSTFSLNSLAPLPTGEYSITDVPLVSLFASVRPRAQFAAPGEQVRFLVEMQNSGIDPASEASTVSLDFQGLENITFSGGTLNNGIWTVSSLAAGASETLEITATRATDEGAAGLTLAANNTGSSVQNANQVAQIFDPVYETGQHVNISNMHLTPEASPDVMGIIDADFTIEGWIRRKAGDSGSSYPIISQLNAQNTNTLRIGITNLRPILEFNGSRLASGFVTQSNTWYHLAFTFNKSTGERKIFVNGIQQASDITSSGPIVLDSPLIIGGWHSESVRNTIEGFDGFIHNLRIWNAPLSRDEILQRKHQHIPENDPLSDSLMADFRFTEGQGVQAFDYAGGNILTSPQDDIWGAREGVLFGNQSAVATQENPAAVGQPGATLTVSDVSDREVLLHLSGRPDGPDRTPADTGESFAGAIASLVTGRPNVTWSLSTTPGDTLQADVELAYGALSVAQEPAERLFILYRTGPDQDWNLDQTWTHNTDTQTFTRSGAVQTGEYSVISLPTAKLGLEVELISTGSPHEDSFELRFTATNTGVDSPTETTLATNAGNLSGFTDLQADGSGFDTETFTWTFGEIATGESKVLTVSGRFTNNIPFNLQSTISGAGVLNLSSAEDTNKAQLISKPPYGSGKALNVQSAIPTNAGGADLGLVNSSFTVEAWVKPFSVSGDRSILGQEWVANPVSRQLHLILRGGKVHMGFYADDLQGETDVPVGQWSHVAFTYDVVTNNRVVYLNGIADGNNTANGPFTGEGDVFIGQWDGSNFLNGQLDELRIWNRVRSPEEIRQNMHRTISKTEPDFQDLTAYYRFDEGEGTIAHDLRGGFHATIPGSVESVWQNSAAPVGQQSVVVDESTTAGLGNAGSRIEVSNLTGNSAKLFSYGRLNGMLRTTENSSDIFTGLENEGIEARTAKVWGIKAAGESSATVSISFSDLEDEPDILESPGLIYRPNNSAPWQLLADSVWIKDVTQKTFTYSGTLASGEYAMAAFPFLRSALHEGVAGWRLIGSPGPFARYSNVLATSWTQGFPGASQGEGGDPNVFFYDEATRSWVAPSSITNIFGTNSDFGSSSASRAVIMYFFQNQFPYQLQYSGVLNSQEVTLELNATVVDPDDGNQGWHLISNPYPFPIDWTKVVADGLDNVAPPIFLYDANTFTGFGGYRVHYGFNIPSLPDDIMHDGIIPPFQAFFIRTSQVDGTPGTITFRPSHESTTGDGQLFDDSDEPSETDDLYLLLSVENLQTKQVKTSLLSISTGGERALFEVGQPVALTHNSMDFGIQGANHNALALASMNMEYGKEYTLPVRFSAPQSGIFELSIPSVESWKHGRITLTDHSTGEVVDVTHSAVYQFEHTMVEKKNVKEGKVFQSQAGKATQRSEQYQIPPPASPNLKNVLYGAEDDLTPRFSITIAFTENVEEQSVDIPVEFVLRQNYPNPFNPSTIIEYGLPETSTIRIDVFNMLGQRLATLVNGEQTAGYHRIQFDGRRLASGVYFYRLQSGRNVITQKMVLVK